MGTNDRPMKRVAVFATLGAEVARLNIGYEHRDAWRGVLEMSIDDFRRTVAVASNTGSVGELLAHLITSDLGPLQEFGVAVLHQRQADAYTADCDSWAAQPPSVKQGQWRSKPPTREQRMLMIRMSQKLGVPLPCEVTRGEAAAWIEQHGGNPRFSKEK